MPILNRDECPIYFEQFGPLGQTDLPRLLLIQGIGVSGSGWHPQVLGLKEFCSIVSFDNRGIGRSVPCSGPITVEKMADDAIAVLDHLGWSTAHIAGHSLGGVVAQQLALNHPKRVDSLSLFCTFARGVDGARATPRVIWLGLRSRVGTRAMRRRAFIEMLWPSDALAKLDTVRLADELAPIVGRDLADFLPVMNLQLKALGAHDVSSRLIELGNIPTVVVSGKSDPIALPAYGREIVQLIPGSRFIEFEDGSHGLTIQHPERVNDILLQALNSRSGNSGAV